VKLEVKLQEEIMENKKLCATYLHAQGTMKSYAQVALTSAPQPASMIPITRKRTINKTQPEVILVKPKDENDTRSNEEIKSTVIKQLSDIKNKIKIIKIRQMRRKGVVIEMSGKEDVKLLRSTNIDKIGLEIREPKKINPSIMIYDVEEELKKEELKEDFIRKNFDNLVPQDQAELLEKVKFLNSFKTKMASC